MSITNKKRKATKNKMKSLNLMTLWNWAGNLIRTRSLITFPGLRNSVQAGNFLSWLFCFLSWK